MVRDSGLTEKEEKFCLIYAQGPAPYNGNKVRCWQLVFNETTNLLRGKEEVEVAMKAQDLLNRKDIQAFIEKINAANIVNASTLRPRLTQTLLKIADECSTLQPVDRWGVKISPAALRSVAVNAVSKLTDMYGIKEDIAHKISLEGADGEGITFNLIAPQPAPKAEDELIGD